MWDMASNPAMQAALAAVSLVFALVAGVWILKALRPTTTKADMNPADLAQNFEEMRLEGEIDEAELRKIKSVLGKSSDA